MFKTDIDGKCNADAVFKSKCIETWMLEEMLRVMLSPQRRKKLANRSRETIDFSSHVASTSSNAIKERARKAQRETYWRLEKICTFNKLFRFNIFDYCKTV